MSHHGTLVNQKDFAVEVGDRVDPDDADAIRYDPDFERFVDDGWGGAIGWRETHPRIRRTR